MSTAAERKRLKLFAGEIPITENRIIKLKVWRITGAWEGNVKLLRNLKIQKWGDEEREKKTGFPQNIRRWRSFFCVSGVPIGDVTEKVGGGWEVFFSFQSGIFGGTVEKLRMFLEKFIRSRVASQGEGGGNLLPGFLPFFRSLSNTTASTEPATWKTFILNLGRIFCSPTLPFEKKIRV